MLLTEFDRLPAEEAAAAVRVWADVPRWVERIVAERPYASVAALEARATELASDWDESDLDGALAHHPRIGERTAGTGSDAAHSRREQSGMADADDATSARIAAGNAEYERRFGRVFLIRAAGRSPQDMLAALERRLQNAPATEAREATAQLAEIAVLRLRATVTEEA